MKNYESYFMGYEVPENLKAVATLVMRRFVISGQCDGMYICNCIAFDENIGDGQSHFWGDMTTVTDPKKSAEYLQRAYSDNILPEEVDELAEILKSRRLDRTRAVLGIYKFAHRCQDELREKRDLIKVCYLERCIKEANETAVSIMLGGDE